MRVMRQNGEGMNLELALQMLAVRLGYCDVEHDPVMDKVSVKDPRRSSGCGRMSTRCARR